MLPIPVRAPRAAGPAREIIGPDRDHRPAAGAADGGQRIRSATHRPVQHPLSIRQASWQAVDVYFDAQPTAAREASLARAIAAGRHVYTESSRLGDGVIDFRAISARVLAAGYRGYAEVEIFNQQIWDAPPDGTAATVRRRFAELLG